jgi:hypothetical protein
MRVNFYRLNFISYPLFAWFSVPVFFDAAIFERKFVNVFIGAFGGVFDNFALNLKVTLGVGRVGDANCNVGARAHVLVFDTSCC